MKKILHHGRRFLLTITLALSGLGLAATVTPAAHAGGVQIGLGIANRGAIVIWGSGFDPGAQVNINVLNYGARCFPPEFTVYASAGGWFSPPAGTFSTTLNAAYYGQFCPGLTYVAADQYPPKQPWQSYEAWAKTWIS